MANKGYVDCTTTASAAFGPGVQEDIVMQNISESNDIYVTWDGDPVATEDVRIAAGESISTQHLPSRWKRQAETGFKAITEAGTARLIWSV